MARSFLVFPIGIITGLGLIFAAILHAADTALVGQPNPMASPVAAATPSAVALVVELRQPIPTAVLGASSDTWSNQSGPQSPPAVQASLAALPAKNAPRAAVAPVQLSVPSAMANLAPSNGGQRPTPAGYVRALRGGPQVHVAPDAQSALLSGLYYDTYLPVYGQQRDARGTIWYQTLLWGVLPGWIRADQTAPGDPPPLAPATPGDGGAGDESSSVPAEPSQIEPLTTTGTTLAAVNARVAADVASDSSAVVPAGQSLQVTGWQTDGDGQVWYRVSLDGQASWVFSRYVELERPAASLDRSVVVGALNGKGMWVPTSLLQMADPNAIVGAAKQLGLTHLYVEAGDSGRGFYGAKQIDRLLPVAHANGIQVIGWVMTELWSVPTDVDLTVKVAQYHSPSGDRLDGVAPDLESHLDPADVQAYTQIVRSRVGGQELLVGVLYPAGGWFGREYPIQQSVARSFDAIAPMAYWNDQRRSYSADEVARYVAKAVSDMRAAVGDPGYPIEVAGQTYDSFGRNGQGASSPTGPEITAALGAAHDAGAVGISFFQWATTTPAEWDAILQYQWR